VTVDSSAAAKPCADPQTPKEKAEGMHPLELLPFFRRWPRSMVRNVVYTMVFSLLIASGFIVIGLPFANIRSWSQFGELISANIIVALCIGFTWHFFMQLLGPLMRRVNGKPFWVVIATYTVLGCAITQVGFVLLSLIPGVQFSRGWLFTAQSLITMLCISFVISLIMGIAWRSRISGLTMEAELARERERLEAAERAAVQANLRALQAQIEPHFLFNTLANVTGLIHKQPDTAKHMLEEFISYLRATLAATREDHTTLGQEFALMKSFLAVLQVRMGERLQVSFDLPDQLSSMPMPQMLLQPLVENAIKHGLEPYIDGGEISLSARMEGPLVAITVADTGVGFGNTTSGGLGLQNVRERLAKLFGEAGRLTIEDNAPRGTRSGTRVTITLPLQESKTQEAK